MYSVEIQKVLEENNYNIDSETYIDICQNSPQICHVKYDAFQDNFLIETRDGYQFYLKVFPKQKT
jgi:hypothetical protein